MSIDIHQIIKLWKSLIRCQCQCKMRVRWPCLALNGRSEIPLNLLVLSPLVHLDCPSQLSHQPLNTRFSFLLYRNNREKKFNMRLSAARSPAIRWTGKNSQPRQTVRIVLSTTRASSSVQRMHFRVQRDAFIAAFSFLKTTDGAMMKINFSSSHTSLYVLYRLSRLRRESSQKVI